MGVVSNANCGSSFKIGFSWLLMGAGVLSPVPSWASTTSAVINSMLKQNLYTEYLDFVLQDVCVDANDRPIAGDPAVCPNHRNVRIGESLPYIRTDFGQFAAYTDGGPPADPAYNFFVGYVHHPQTGVLKQKWVKAGNRHQSVTSYPVSSQDGKMLVMVAKSMRSGATAFNNFTFGHVHLTDGFDLLETEGGYISGVRTSDGQCGDQIITAHSGQRQDGWISFPTVGLASGASGAVTHYTQIQRFALPVGCPFSALIDNPTISYASWVRTQAKVTFQSGKQLDAIQSYHFADANLGSTNNALEKFFFTKEYGFTRWESWIPRDRCYATYFNLINSGAHQSRIDEQYITCNDPDAMLKYRCDGGGVTTMGGQTWIRNDCRDSTNYSALGTPMVPLVTGMADTDPNDANYAIKVGEALTVASTVNLLPGLYFSVTGQNIPQATHGTYHAKAVVDGTTYAGIRQLMSQSAAAVSGIQLVYQQVLGRNATASQLTGYQNTFAAGTDTVVTLRRKLAESTEWTNLVTGHYVRLKGVQPTTAQLNAYRQQFISGTMTLSSYLTSLGGP